MLAVSDAFEAISANAQRELEKQASLLAGLDGDLRIVSRVAVHKEFLSPNARKAIELGEPGRTLADYISQAKMRQVASACTRTHGKLLRPIAQSAHLKLCSQEDLRDRLHQAQDLMTRLRDGTDGIRAAVADHRCVSIAEGAMSTLIWLSLLNDAEVSSRRARDMLKKVSDLAASLDSESTP